MIKELDEKISELLSLRKEINNAFKKFECILHEIKRIIKLNVKEKDYDNIVCYLDIYEEEGEWYYIYGNISEALDEMQELGYLTQEERDQL